MARVLITDSFPAGLYATVNAAPVWGMPARSLFLSGLRVSRVVVRDAAGNARFRWRLTLKAVRRPPGVAYDEADWSAISGAVPLPEDEP